MIALLDEEAHDETPEIATWESDYLKTRDDSGDYAKLFRELTPTLKVFANTLVWQKNLWNAAANGEAINRDEDAVMRKSIPAGLCIIKMHYLLPYAKTYIILLIYFRLSMYASLHT